MYFEFESEYYFNIVSADSFICELSIHMYVHRLCVHVYYTDHVYLLSQDKSIKVT